VAEQCPVSTRPWVQSPAMQKTKQTKPKPEKKEKKTLKLE
jgi:hypothetical protein